MFFPIQESFAGGEISPRMYGRGDTPQYKKGVAYSENWVHLPQGPLRLRGGSQFLANAFINAPFRVIPFNLQQQQDYCAELGAGYIRILNLNGPIPAEGPELVVNGSFAFGSSGWVTANHIGCQYDFVGAMQFCDISTWNDEPPNPGPPFRPGHTVLPPGIPSLQQNFSNTVVPNGAYFFSFGVAEFGPFTFQVRVHDIGAGVDVYTQSTGGTYVNVPIVITGGAGCYIICESTSPTGTKGLSIVFQGPISFRSQSGTPALITGMPWTAAMLRGIQYVQDVKEGLFLVHPQMTPMQVKYDNTTNAFTCAPVAFLTPTVSAVTAVGLGASVMTVTGTPSQAVNAIVIVDKGATNLAGTPTVNISLDGGATVTFSGLAISTTGNVNLGNTGLTLHFTDASFVSGDVYLFTASGPVPSDWTTNNYPSCVEIWQSRLWFANTPTLPSTLWASRVFNYYDFSTDAVLTEASPLTLTSNTKGAIKWIRGKQSFLVGTDLHEDTITSSTQIVSALDAQLLRQSAYGSGEIQAIDVGDQVLFISRDYTKVRSLNFNFDTQAWLSHDITWYAQHITAPGIVAIAFARDPDNTIYVVLSDGSMRMCTYDRLAETVAWSRYTTAGNMVNDCMVTVDFTGATTWLAVNRNGQWMIETIAAYNPGTAQWMDCWQPAIPVVATLPGPLYTLTVSGLQNLNGLQCVLIVDGVFGGYVVPMGGTFTIPWGNPVAAAAIVGLAYPQARVIGLPLDEGVMYGTAQGQMKRRGRIFVRLLTSTLPLINGSRPSNQRTPSTPMGTVQPPIPFADIYSITLGWDRYAQWQLDQPLPFPTEIAAIFGGSDVSQAE